MTAEADICFVKKRDDSALKPFGENMQVWGRFPTQNLDISTTPSNKKQHSILKRQFIYCFVRIHYWCTDNADSAGNSASDVQLGVLRAAALTNPTSVVGGYFMTKFVGVFFLKNCDSFENYSKIYYRFFFKDLYSAYLSF